MNDEGSDHVRLRHPVKVAAEAIVPMTAVVTAKEANPTQEGLPISLPKLHLKQNPTTIMNDIGDHRCVVVAVRVVTARAVEGVIHHPPGRLPVAHPPDLGPVDPGMCNLDGRRIYSVRSFENSHQECAVSSSDWWLLFSSYSPIQLSRSSAHPT
jgi:hypothetical protein